MSDSQEGQAGPWRLLAGRCGLGRDDDPVRPSSFLLADASYADCLLVQRGPAHPLLLPAHAARGNCRRLLPEAQGVSAGRARGGGGSPRQVPAGGAWALGWGRDAGSPPPPAALQAWCHLRSFPQNARCSWERDRQLHKRGYFPALAGDLQSLSTGLETVTARHRL